MTLDTNSFPFFDDFDASKNFHKILFVPGNAVQARELTQIQSILQEQIKKMGNHFFKNGTVIIPGHTFFDNTVYFVKLETVYEDVNVENYLSTIIGKEVTGSVSGVTGYIVHAEKSTLTDPVTLFVKYTGANGTVTTFANTDILTESESGLSMQVKTVDDHQGKASICTINDGVYYINGYFVGVSKQIVSVSKYSSTPSSTIGLQFNESVVTEKEDDSLYDNALGFANYTAPGGQRYKIELVLTTKDVDYTSTTSGENLTFIDILQVKNGEIQYQYNDTKYAEFERLFARRTYDESGDYVVRDFKFKAREYRSNNRGEWTSRTPYLAGDIVSSGGLYFQAFNSNMSSTTAPVPSATNPNEPIVDGDMIWSQVYNPTYNDGLETASGVSIDEHQTAASKFVVTTSPGKAYIKGYEVETSGKQTLVLDKARTVKTVNNTQISPSVGRYVRVTNVAGLPSIGVCQSVNLRDITNTTIGTAFVRSIELESGTAGSASAIWKLFIFGIKLNSGKDFQFNVRNVQSTTPYTFTCDLVVNQYSLGSVGRATSSTTTLNGENTFFAKWIKVGYVLKYGATTSHVTAVTNEVTLTTAAGLSVPSDTPVSNIFVQYVDLLGDNTSFLPLSNSFVKTLRDANNEMDTAYVCLREWSFTASATTHTLSIVLPEIGETFLLTGHLVYNSTDSAYLGSPSFSYVGGDAKQLQIGGLTSGKTYRVLTAVKRLGQAAKEKVKTLRTKTIIVTKSTAGGTSPATASVGIYDYTGGTISASPIATGYNSDSSKIILTEADIVKVLSVVRIDDSGVEQADDIASWYSLDDGQTPTHYDVGFLTKKDPNNTNTNYRLKITFEYYDHGYGDYFSVDSYTGLPYENVPVFSKDGIVVKLADVVDFRPRKSDDGVNFSNTGAIVSNALSSAYPLETSYSYYLPRTDVISLDLNGNFEVLTGTPSDFAEEPRVKSENSIKLVSVTVPQYTVYPKTDVSFKYQNHRRYTMSDIGKMESRLSNVEQYVALSALEKATADMKIYDENGLDRFKNGFLVDQFKDLAVADTSSSELRASVDSENLQMSTPVNTPNTVSKVEVSALSQNMLRHGQYAILNGTTVDFLAQRFATRSEFINPFAVVTYYGNSKMTPSLDQWAETVNNEVLYMGEVKEKNVNAGFSNTANWFWGGDNTSQSSAINFVTNEINKASKIPGVKFNVGNNWYSTGTGLSASTALASVRSLGDRQGIWSGSLKASFETAEDTVTSFTSQLTTAVRMRSKTSIITVTALKPNMAVNVLLDNQNINGYVIPCAALLFSAEPVNVKGTLDDIYNDASDVVNGTYPRHYYTNGTSKTGERSYDVFNFGTIIRNNSTSSSTTATAIAVAKERVTIGGIQYWAVYVTNVLGNLTDLTGRTVYDHYSGQSIGYVNSYQSSMGTQTNSIGSFYGLAVFNSNFTTGKKTIKVIGSSGVNDDGVTLTDYTAFGNIMTNSKTIRRDITRTNVSAGWQQVRVDPLAQSFLVNSNTYKSGIVLESVDLYFAQAGTTQSPILVDIVTVENGYPTQIVVDNAWSNYQPAANSVVATTTSEYATNFKFVGPVYLAPGNEYAIRIRSNDTKVKMWIAQAGEPAVATSSAGGQTVDAAALNSPSNDIGTLFKSQNASTWTAEQTQDLKFRLKRYDFTTSVSGYFDAYVSKPVYNSVNNENYHTLAVGSVRSIQTKPGDATRELVVVNFPNHNYVNGQVVTYVNGSGSVVTSTVYKIINDDNVVVDKVTADTMVKLIRGIRYDSFILSTDDFLPSNGTTLTYTVKHFNTDKSYDADYSISDANEPVDLSVTKMVNVYNPSTTITNETTLLRVYLASTSSHVTPIINLGDIHFHMFNNRVNSPSHSDFLLNTTIAGTVITNKPIGGVQVWTGTGIQYNSADNTLEINNADIDFSKFTVGAWLKIAGTTTNDTADGSEAQILRLDYDTAKVYVDKTLVDYADTGTSTVTQYALFIDEFAPTGGTAEAKYVHAPVSLETQATSLKVMFAASIPNDADIALYYRTGIAGSSSLLSSKDWTSVSLTYLKTLGTEFIDREYDIGPVDSFDQFQVKIVMKSTNSAAVPKFKDLRVIALA